MPELLLFTDGSVNASSGVGFGAYLAVMDNTLSLDALRPKVHLKKFEATSSTKLELQTLLWALEAVGSLAERIVVHTDSQNITGLIRRRDRLEKNEFRSKEGRPLNHSELYQRFYALVDSLVCEFVKIRGHKPSKEKDALDERFSLVDRASRNALRAEPS